MFFGLGCFGFGVGRSAVVGLVLVLVFWSLFWCAALFFVWFAWPFFVLLFLFCFACLACLCFGVALSLRGLLCLCFAVAFLLCLLWRLGFALHLALWCGFGWARVPFCFACFGVVFFGFG